MWRRSLADADVLAFSGVVGTTEAGAPGTLDLLGTRRNVRAQRAHQGTDRTGVSGGSDRALSAADGELRHLLKLRLFSSALVFLAIAAPWHILAELRNPAQGNVRGFLWFYFVNEHILRFLNKRVPRDYDTVPLLLFWALLVLWLIPWTVFLPQSLQEVPRRWREFRAQMTRRQRAYLLFFLWNLVIVGFFSLSTRQEYYTIPAIPGMALLVGGWLQRERSSAAGSRERRSGRISSAMLLAVGVIIAAVGFALLFFSKAPAPGTDLSDLLRKNPQDYALSFGHFLDLTPQAMGAFRVPLFGFSLAFLLGTLANWILRRRARAGAGNVALVAMMVVLLACVRIAFGIFSPILSSKDLAMAIREQYRPGDQIVVIGLYENASSLNFYTGIPLHSLRTPGGNMWYGTQFPGAPRVFETQASFVEMWHTPQRVFLWAEEDDPAGVARIDEICGRSSRRQDYFFESADGAAFAIVRRPSFRSKTSPRQWMRLPIKLAAQTNGAIRSRSGSKKMLRSTCRSSNTASAVTTPTANRTANVSANSAHAHSAPWAASSVSNAHGRPKVKSRPAYPQRRASRMVRDQRS
jgi:hypothetical protein